MFYFNKKEASFARIETPKQGSLITLGPEAPLRVEWKLGVSLADKYLYSGTQRSIPGPLLCPGPSFLCELSVFSGAPVLKAYKSMNFVKPRVKETCFRTLKEEFNSLNV